MALLTSEDVLLFIEEDEDIVDAVVKDVISLAKGHVPALADEDSLTQDQKDSITAVLRSAAIRFIETGNGTILARSHPGGFSETLASSARKGLLYDYEIAKLKLFITGEKERKQSKAFVLGGGSYVTPSTPTPPSGTITIASVTGLIAALAGKVDDDDSRLSDARTPTAHTHEISEIDGLTAELSGLQDAIDGVSGGGAYLTNYYTKPEVDSALAGKADTSHTQAISTITGLQTLLDAISTDINSLKAFDETAATDEELAAAYASLTANLADYLKIADASDLFADKSIETGAIPAIFTALSGKANVTDLDGINAYISGVQSDLEAALATLTDTVDGKADQATTYTKTEVDTALSGKASTASVSAKADQATTYTKTEVDTALSGKASTSSVAAKADASSVYTKTEVDSALSAKANQSTTYTKTEVDTALSGKAASSHTHDDRYYTESEVDTLLSGKASTASVSGKADASSVYTKSEVDAKASIWTKYGTASGQNVLGSFSTVFSGTASLSAGVIYFIPFEIFKTQDFSALGFAAQAQSSPTMTAAIYAASTSTGLPTTVLKQYSQVSISATGVFTFPESWTPSDTGLYWVGIKLMTGTVTLQGGKGNPKWIGEGSATPYLQSIVYSIGNGTGASLPDNPTLTWPTNTTGPIGWLVKS